MKDIAEQLWQIWKEESEDLHLCDRCNTFTPDAIYVTHPDYVNVKVGMIKLICLCRSCHHNDEYEANLDGGFSTHSEETEKAEPHE